MIYAQQIPHFIKYQGNGKKIWEEIEKGKKDKGKDKEKDKDKDLYTLTFRIYNVETGGAALWEETHPNVPIKKKESFEVILGTFTPLDLKFDADYWLSIEIDGKGEIAPREKLTSVGYAYMADDSYKFGGRYPDDFALFHHSHTGEDIVSAVKEALNADTVDKLHASAIPTPGYLLSLDSLGKFPASIISGAIGEAINADTVDGLHATASNNPLANTLIALDATAKFPASVIPAMPIVGNADTVDNIHASAIPTANYLYPLNGNAKFPASILEGIVANADKLDGKDSSEFSLIGHLHTLMDLTDVTSDLRAAFLAAGTAGANGANRLATMADIIATPPPLGLWTDEGTYIYPNNVGSGFQVRDAGNLAIATTGIIDAGTPDPKGTLTIGQSLAGNNTDYSVVISRHGTPPNPGTYSFSRPALLVQDFSGVVPLLGRDNDGIVRINAYRIGDTTTNAANATLFNVTNDQGEALRVDGLRNTFIGYGQKYTTSNQIGSLFVDGNVGIGTTAPQSRVTIKGQANNGLTIIGTGGDPRVLLRPSGAEHGEIVLFNAMNIPTVWIQSSTGYTYFNGGNVGIGTTNPQSPLHIANAKVALNLQDIEHLGSDPGYGSYIKFTDSAGETVAYLGDGGSSMLM